MKDFHGISILNPFPDDYEEPLEDDPDAIRDRLFDEYDNTD